MAEDLANAIVIASEKMQAKENIFKGISHLAETLETSRDCRVSEIVPLYEHVEKIECRDKASKSFERCSLKTWYTFGSEVDQKYSSVFVATSSILSEIHMSNNYYTYYQCHDKFLEQVFIGRLVQLDQFENESNNRKHYREKRIAALFRRK